MRFTRCSECVSTTTCRSRSNERNQEVPQIGLHVRVEMESGLLKYEKTPGGVVILGR